MSHAPALLDVSHAQKVSYCIPEWLKTEQIRVNTAAVPGRLQPTQALRSEPCAIVCYGPSLNTTWEQIRDFKYVMTCSGAHKFVIERGIVPTWHCDVDPRKHKIALIGEPHPDVKYLLASTCHPTYFKLLQARGCDVTLWHVFDGADEALRVLPPGEWALTGGCSVGLRALALARFLGFRELDVFGMDGSEGPSGKHAAAHPSQAPQSDEVEFNGRMYRTTPAFLEAARQTAHELDDLKDVTARFHGDGLVQAMMRGYQRQPIAKASIIAFNKPELISDDYRRLNAQLHDDNLAYGVGGGAYAPEIIKIADRLKTRAILDYGCGKGLLAKAIPFPIWEYDPAIPGKQESPRPAELVVCTDVLEHIEPDRLPFVLDDLRRCVTQVGYFVIHTGPAAKTLADGRNAHLIQQDAAWWTERLGAFFTIGKVDHLHPHTIRIVVGVKKAQRATLQTLTAGGPQLDFSRMAWRTTPYPIGCAPAVLDPLVYAALAATFPPIDLFRAFGSGNRKWSLSSVNHHAQYEAFITKTPAWMAFYRYVKAPTFIDQIRAVLAAQDIDVLEHKGKLKTRFEFSVLPADGGCLRPHTDIPSKLVTVVLGMPGPDDAWLSSYGGGTDVLVPTDPSVVLDDYRADWSAFSVLESYAYQPNQAVLFVKTPTSWHGVAPMTGPAEALRKTLTINVEKAV